MSKSVIFIYTCLECKLSFNDPECRYCKNKDLIKSELKDNKRDLKSTIVKMSEEEKSWKPLHEILSGK